MLNFSVLFSILTLLIPFLLYNPLVHEQEPSQSVEIVEPLPDTQSQPIMEEVVTPSLPAIETYWIEEHETENKFVNLIDGYAIYIPKDMKVVDMSISSVRSVLEDSHRRLEIYRQDIKTDYYSYYSNRFITNKDDHILEYEATVNINGYSAYILQWSRAKLKNIKNDKNYYASVDIKVGKSIYSFFFKSDLPFYQCGGYTDILSKFYTFTPTVKGETPRFSQLDNTFWNYETEQTFKKYFSDDSNLIWGIFEPSVEASLDKLKVLEQKFDYDFPIILLYSNFLKEYNPYIRNVLNNTYANNKIVELTLQTVKQSHSEGNMVYDILDGKYDAFLQAYAKDIADFGHPVLFRFCNEMNGDWCMYSAYHYSRDTELYKELYKYVYQIFKNAGAKNVIWVWNPNEESYPNYKWNHELMYYPGDEYVDVIGLTGYNNGTFYKSEKWRSFREIYDPIYSNAVERYDKPFMITEFSSSSIGGNKELWFKDMFSNISQYSKIKIAVLWNGCDFDSKGNISRPYFVDETEGLTQIMKDNLK